MTFGSCIKQTRTPMRIYKRITSYHVNYIIDYEDGKSCLGIWLTWSEKYIYSGYLDSLPQEVQETSWLDILITTGITKDMIDTISQAGKTSLEIDTFLNEKINGSRNI